MSVVEEIIRIDNDETLSFGNYLSTKKQKMSNFELGGNIYNIKTHNEITRLEKNDKLLMETVPGATVHFLKIDAENTAFSIEGFEDTQVTIELEPEQSYKIFVNDINIGKMKTGMSGKINFSIGLNSTPQQVNVVKI